MASRKNNNKGKSSHKLQVINTTTNRGASTPDVESKDRSSTSVKRSPNDPRVSPLSGVVSLQKATKGKKTHARCSMMTSIAAIGLVWALLITESSGAELDQLHHGFPRRRGPRGNKVDLSQVHQIQHYRGRTNDIFRGRTTEWYHKKQSNTVRSTPMPTLPFTPEPTSSLPTPRPTPRPTVTRTPRPTIAPTPGPTSSPTTTTAEPMPAPTPPPTPEPTPSLPTPGPTPRPTKAPTPGPTPFPILTGNQGETLFSTNVAIDFLGNLTQATNAQIAALEQGFLKTYNALKTKNGISCDPLNRQVVNATIDVDPDLQPTTRTRFSYFFKIQGSCRGCQANSTLFHHGKYTQSNCQGQLPTPIVKDFVTSYNDTIQRDSDISKVFIKTVSRGSELQVVECAEDIKRFGETVEVFFVGNPNSTEEEEALADAFVSAYNYLTRWLCDQGFRTIESAEIVHTVDESERFLRGNRPFTRKVEIVARCRRCPDTSLIGPYGTRRALAVSRSSPYSGHRLQDNKTCFCDVDAPSLRDVDESSGRRPNPVEFTIKYAEGVRESRLPNVQVDSEQLPVFGGVPTPVPSAYPTLYGTPGSFPTSPVENPVQALVPSASPSVDGFPTSLPTDSLVPNPSPISNPRPPPGPTPRPPIPTMQGTPGPTPRPPIPTTQGTPVPSAYPTLRGTPGSFPPTSPGPPFPTSGIPTASFRCISNNFELKISVEDYISSGGSINNASFVSRYFGHPIGTWCFSPGVDSFRRLFEYQYGFNEDLSAWSTSGITDMSGMFEGASSFDQPLADWDVSSVSDMSYMFRGAIEFDQNLCSWGPSIRTFSTLVNGMFYYTACESTEDPNVTLPTVQPLCKAQCP